MKVDGFGGEIRQSDWLTHSFPWLRPFATDLWGGLTDFQIQGLCMSLLIEPFKKILHCHWLVFSTDSQREVFINTALVFTTLPLSYYFERLLLRAISTSYIWKHFRQCSVCDCGKRFGISIQRLYTELEKNIDTSRTNFVDKLLSGAINNTSRSLARNFGAESYC